MRSASCFSGEEGSSNPRARIVAPKALTSKASTHATGRRVTSAMICGVSRLPAALPHIISRVAEMPPSEQLPGILVYHLPHLVDDLIVPEVVHPEPEGIRNFRADDRGAARRHYGRLSRREAALWRAPTTTPDSRDEEGGEA